ncbi:hypothetical protein H4R24_005563 [Coemansia sp. RSA 988]|nr:hypothetical protein H4R24_005563 [Coemansia sp. RSA 988]
MDRMVDHRHWQDQRITWTLGSEQQAADILHACRRLCNKDSTAQQVRQTCAVADTLGLSLIRNRRSAVSATAFVAYVEFYAHLARPDITQRVLQRFGAQWRRPPMAVCNAQILALLRFRADCTAGHPLAAKTAADPQIVKQRLELRSVRAIVDRELRRERWQRLLLKTMEYAVPAAMAGLVAKWLWFYNNFALAALAPTSRATAMAVIAIALALGMRLLLRHSVMGILTAPRAPSPPLTHGVPLTPDSERAIWTILQRAFPAAPSEQAMDEIGGLLNQSSAPVKASWRLRVALRWCRIARRMAVVDPALLSIHGLRQRLVSLWLRCLPRMFEPHDRCEASVRTADAQISELADFVRIEFVSVPLALSSADAVAIARFASSEASQHGLRELLDLNAAGLLAIPRPEPQEPLDVMSDFLANWRAADEVLLQAVPEDIHRARANAAMVIFTALLQQLLLLAPAHRLSKSHRHLLGFTLRRLLRAASHDSLPLSPAIYHAAFAAARELRCCLLATQLAAMLERRFRSHDPHALSLLTHPPKSSTSAASTVSDWRQHGTPPGLPLIVAILTPYLAQLAQASAATGKPGIVDTSIARWHALGILSHSASIQCLASASTALPLPNSDTTTTPATNPASGDRAGICMEHWAKHGCQLAEAGASASGIDDLAQPLYRLLTRCLDHCRSFDDDARALRIFSIWEALVSRRPDLHRVATAEFNTLSLALLVDAADAALHGQGTHTQKSRVLLSRALHTLDLMHNLAQLPPARDFDRLRSIADRLQVNISDRIRCWLPVLKTGPQSTKLTSFAKSLF